MRNILCLFVLLASGLVLPAHVQAQTPSDRQLQAIEKIMAPIRKRLTDILEADKTGQYKTYKADLEGIAAERDRARIAELLAKLDRNHLAFMRKAYAEAKINNADLRTQVAQILGSIKFTMGEFANIQIDYTTPNAVLPSKFEVTLNCPMAIKDENATNQVVGLCESSASDCSMGISAMAEFAGGCRGKTASGDKVEVPVGTFSKITVAAQSDIHYDGVAFAVAGYAQVNAKFGVHFRAPGIDKIVFAKEVFTFAPLIWYSRIQGESSNFVAQATFSGNFTGGTVLTAQVYTEAFCISVPAVTWSSMLAGCSLIDQIKVTGSN
jgi:hypothetical protein